MSEISTGRFIEQNRSRRDDRLITSPGNLILFDAYSSAEDKFSPFFSIQPGEAALIDAYNLDYDQYIYLNRLVVSSYAPTTGCNCDPRDMQGAYGQPGQITYIARMTLGGDDRAWALYNPSSSQCEHRRRLQMLLAIPGKYNLELDDVSMLGSLRVEAQIWKLTQTPYLPNNYFAGILDPCEA